MPPLHLTRHVLQVVFDEYDHGFLSCRYTPNPIAYVHTYFVVMDSLCSHSYFCSTAAFALKPAQALKAARGIRFQLPADLVKAQSAEPDSLEQSLSLRLPSSSDSGVH